MAVPLTSSGQAEEQVNRLKLLHSVRELPVRVRARPVVVRAVLEAMRRQTVDDSEALDRLRRAAMSARTCIEVLCASVAASPALAAQLPAAPPPVIPAIIDHTRVP